MVKLLKPQGTGCCITSLIGSNVFKPMKRVERLGKTTQRQVSSYLWTTDDINGSYIYIYIDIYIDIHIYIYTYTCIYIQYIHTYLSTYITLHCIALHCIALRLHYITYITLFIYIYVYIDTG